MSNIVTTKENLPHLFNNDDFVYDGIKLIHIKEAKINPTNKEILLCSFGERKIKDLDANFAGERLKTLINLTIFESGFKTENISDLIIMVIRDIFSDFSHLTISEVGIAYRKGVRGELGEFMGLSVRTFYVWVRTYIDEVRIEAMKSLFQIKVEEPITEDKKKKSKMIWLNAFIKDFETYKLTKQTEIYDYNNSFYEYCINNNIASLTKEEKIEIKERAKRELVAEHNPLNAKSFSQIKDFKNLIKEVVSNSEESKDKVINKSKRIAISYIYDKLIASNVELRDLIREIESETKSIT